MEFNNILIDHHDAVSVVTINRPKKLNALNRETISELHQALKSLDEDKEVKAVILIGSGEKAFVAGADISEFADFDVEQGGELAAQGQEELFSFVEDMGTPVIAAVNGFALGGGLELAMSCHFRIASPNAKMGLPEVSLGVIPGYGGTQRLPQLIGKGRAMEMILTAGMIDAKKAQECGLVNHVVEMPDLLPLAMQLAEKIAQNSPVAIKHAINAVNAGFKHDINGYDVEIDAFALCFGTDDFREGTQAFLEKRKANFPGS